MGCGASRIGIQRLMHVGESPVHVAYSLERAIFTSEIACHSYLGESIWASVFRRAHEIRDPKEFSLAARSASAGRPVLLRRPQELRRVVWQLHQHGAVRGARRPLSKEPHQQLLLPLLLQLQPITALY